MSQMPLALGVGVYLNGTACAQSPPFSWHSNPHTGEPGAGGLPQVLGQSGCIVCSRTAWGTECNPNRKKKKRQDSIGFPNTKTIKTLTHFTALSYVVKLQSGNEGVKPLSPVYVGVQTDQENNMQPDIVVHLCDSSSGSG